MIKKKGLIIALIIIVVIIMMQGKKESVLVKSDLSGCLDRRDGKWMMQRK